MEWSEREYGNWQERCQQKDASRRKESGPSGMIYPHKRLRAWVVMAQAAVGAMTGAMTPQWGHMAVIVAGRCVSQHRQERPVLFRLSRLLRATSSPSTPARRLSTSTSFTLPSHCSALLCLRQTSLPLTTWLPVAPTTITAH